MLLSCFLTFLVYNAEAYKGRSRHIVLLPMEVEAPESWSLSPPVSWASQTCGKRSARATRNAARDLTRKAHGCSGQWCLNASLEKWNTLMVQCFRSEMRQFPCSRISALPAAYAAAQQHAIQTRFLFFCLLLSSDIRFPEYETKSWSNHHNLHLPTAPLKCSLRGEFLCGAVPQPLVSTQQDPRLIHGSYRRWIDCWRGAVSTPPRTNAARAWYVLATSNLLQRLRCLVTTADLLPFATRATPNHRNVASCLGPQKQEQMQFFQHLVACKLLNHGMIQPFKNSTSYL